MTIPFNNKIAGIVVAFAAAVSPIAGSAQASDLEAPTGSFTFSGFGSPELDDLPLEISDESASTPVLPPLEVVELGTTPVALDVQTSRAPNRVIQNTWAIGVFR